MNGGSYKGEMLFNQNERSSYNVSYYQDGLKTPDSTAKTAGAKSAMLTSSPM